eukprot:scaffold8721_cov80-Phaeocystis_antarctica.AAC.9
MRRGRTSRRAREAMGMHHARWREEGQHGLKTAVVPVHDGELPIKLTQPSAPHAPLDAARGEEARAVENEVRRAERFFQRAE